MSVIEIHDFGDKIGGARKDMRGNMTMDDIARMTHEERLKLVRKDMVWPTPDHEKMVDDGYTQNAAAMVKLLRDAFPSSPNWDPKTGEAQKVEASKAYVNLLNAARVITGRGKTESELAKAFCEAPEAKEWLLDAKPFNPISHRLERGNPGTRFDIATDQAFGSSNADRVIANGCRYFAAGELDSTSRRMLHRNSEWPRGTTLAAGWLRKMSMGVIPHGEGWALAMYGRVQDDQYTRERLTREGFGAMVGQNYQSREEAEASLNKVGEDHFAQKRDAAKEKREALEARALGKTHNALAPLVARVGPDYREGADATGEDYLKEFGLRGGEFGLWVNQAERQEVLNKGFDSMRDLANVFDLDSSAVSLGGKLAIAFGARGRGGWAAAHYEPGRKVINLTKPSGEGCLAHEWGHSLDHMLGNRAQEMGLVASLSDPDHANYLSNSILKRPDPMTPPGVEETFIRDFHSAMESIATNREPMTKAEALSRASMERATSLRNLMISAQSGLRHLQIQHVDSEKIAAYEAHVAILRQPEEGKELDSITTGMHRILAMQELNSYRFRPMMVSAQEHAIRSINSRNETLELPDNWRGDARPRTTEYSRACKGLDAKRSTPYFSLPHEMFARTFEAVVADTLADQGRGNYFLVAGANAEAFPQDHERKTSVHRFAGLMERLPTILPVRSVDRTRPRLPPLPEPQGPIQGYKVEQMTLL